MHIPTSIVRKIFVLLMFTVLAFVSMKVAVSVAIALILTCVLFVSSIELLDWYIPPTPTQVPAQVPTPVAQTVVASGKDDDEEDEDDGSIPEIQKKHQGKEVVLHLHNGCVMKGRMANPKDPNMSPGNILLCDAVELRRDYEEDRGDLGSATREQDIIDYSYIDPGDVSRVDVMNMDKVS